MPTRVIHRVGRLVVVLATLTALLTMPLATFGARGDNVSASIERAMPQVSSGGLMKFDVSLVNGGSATLANVRFDGTVRSASGAAAAASFVSASISCTTTGTGSVQCPLVSNVAAGTTVEFDLYFTAPSGDGSVYLDGVFTAEARQSNPGGSIDSWLAQSPTVTVRSDPNFFGTWQLANVKPQAAAGTADQRTVVDAPPYGQAYGLVVAQLAPSTSCGVPGVGKEVELSVADGNVPVTVTITYTPAAIGGKSPSQLNFFHDCEELSAGCSRGETNCFDAKWSGRGADKKVVATIRLPHNGLIKGW